jgi:hypothetical protein
MGWRGVGDDPHGLDVLVVGSANPQEESLLAEPRKEYRARIWVRLTDDFIPAPELSKAELEAHLTKALAVGEAGSPIAGLAVEDPRDSSRRRR